MEALDNFSWITGCDFVVQNTQRTNLWRVEGREGGKEGGREREGRRDREGERGREREEGREREVGIEREGFGLYMYICKSNEELHTRKEREREREREGERKREKGREGT